MSSAAVVIGALRVNIEKRNTYKTTHSSSIMANTVVWNKQYFIHRKYTHISTIHNGTGSDCKQSAYKPPLEDIVVLFQQTAKQDIRGQELDMDKLTIGQRRAIEEKPRSGRKK